MSHEIRPGILPLALIGIAAGFLSGMFGIGGGTIIVPALVLWLGMNQRLAAGTSVAAILPTAIVGATTYGLQGNIDWIAAACLAVGIVVGAQVGSYLLARLPVGVIQWSFMVFLAAMTVSMWFIVPQRDDQIDMNWFMAVMLVLVGLITGVLSGVLGVGGGVVTVGVLMFFFGASDLVARGSSLVMMIPGSISGTLGNFRRRNVDLRAAAVIGLVACVGAPLGTMLAGALDPRVGNLLFSLYLIFILGQMLFRKLKPKK